MPHTELLALFLTRRDAIVERIQTLLNAQGKPPDYLQNGALLFRVFEDCFFQDLAPDHARLRGQLERAHWAAGFKPRPIPGLHNGLIDPAEMMVRAFHLWQQTRWPGRNGRLRYAHTLFNLYVVRSLELLSMRLWDDGPNGAASGLMQIQTLLDTLWEGSPADQPAFVRDAGWLLQLAQSPATDDLGAYFAVAQQIADTLPERHRIAIHKAGVRMIAGHLRSQTRYYASKKAVAIDDPAVVVLTRTTNALDYALLIQELVPLLDAYGHAREAGDVPTRLELADSICQALSPDPDLFLNRVELLSAYSMIEHLFVESDANGRAAYTAMGRRHVQYLQDYATLIARAAPALAEDCAHFRPVAGTYSPFGVLYGFSSDLLEHMALTVTQPQALTRFGLEDVFTAGGADKLAWVNGWRRLPHLPRETQALFEYPQSFADAVFARLEQALRRCVGHEAGLVPVVRIHLTPEGPDGTHPQPVTLSDRLEGRCLVSYRAPGGWAGLGKALLTEQLDAGQDAHISGLPGHAANILALMCRGLLADRDS